jgi:hypothetical protein
LRGGEAILDYRRDEAIQKHLESFLDRFALPRI